ncbi:MAG: VOC family protein [Pseudonocardia sp.]|nr:VOC family protein [Pseudonocardia sp.]
MIWVGSIVMGVDMQRAMAFWSQALGYVPREQPEEEWVVLTPASGNGPNISLGPSETPVQDRPRVHLDPYVSDQAAEVDRLIGLGASPVHRQDYPEAADFVVLANTEGNRFCVIAHGWKPACGLPAVVGAGRSPLRDGHRPGPRITRAGRSKAV